MDQDTLVNEPVITQNEPAVATQPDINKTLADSLWGVPQSGAAPAATTNMQPAPADNQNPPAPVDLPGPTDDIKMIEVDDYFKENYGLTQSEFNEKWNKWKEYDTNPPAPTTTEFKYENEDSRRFHELLKENKHEDVWRYLDQQRQIQQLETMGITNAQEAAQIIKANLQFKHSDLKPEQIQRLFDRQYSFPKQPVQGDMDDADYAIEMNTWKNQIQQIEQDMVIDATIAKPELAKYKSNIVLPDIPRIEQAATPVTNQEELARQKAWHDNYVAAVGSNYQNFKGYSVTAKDGDVSLPISYAVTPEEQMASKQLLENFNISEFFDGRWFDQNGTPNVNKIQEDLYLLQNRDKIFQKIANESSAQRYLHQVKKQNNINLNTVNNNPAAPANVDTRTDSQKLGDAMWLKK